MAKIKCPNDETHGEFEALEGCALCLAPQAVQPTVEMLGEEERTKMQKVIDGELEQPGNKTTSLVNIDPLGDMEIGALVIEAEKILQYARDRVVATAEDAKDVTDDLVVIGGIKKRMEAKKKEFLAPVNAIKDELSKVFTDILNPILEANRIYREKWSAWKAEADRLAAEAEETNRMAQEVAKRQAEANNGEFTVDTTEVEVAPAPDRTRTEMGVASAKTNWKFRVLDQSLIPREFLKVDEVHIGQRVRAGVREIAGVEIYPETGVQVRANG